MSFRSKVLAFLMGTAVMLGWGFSASARADEIPEKYRASVNKGLEYLARTQNKAGYWGAGGDQYPCAMTGLSGVALLMEGSTVREGKYSMNIRKAADWLMEQSQRVPQRDGLIFSEHSTETGRYMYGHGFSTLFLACIYGDEEDPVRREKLKDILTRAVKYIGNAQSTRGGFFYTSRVEGGDNDEGSVTVTQLQALRACRNAGIPVPKDLIKKSVKYLEDSTALDGGVIYSLARNGPRPAGGGKPALTAAAIACVFYAGDYKNKIVQEWFQFCKKQNFDQGVGRGAGHDEYTHYYFAQAIYALGDDGWDKMFPNAAKDRMTWTKYRDNMFPHLVKTQSADGSWTQGGPGPVYTTAMFTTIMQLDRGAVPFYQRAIGKSD